MSTPKVEVMATRSGLLLQTGMRKSFKCCSTEVLMSTPKVDTMATLSRLLLQMGMRRSFKCC